MDERKLIGESVGHRTLDGLELARLRNVRGWSQTFFGVVLGGKLRREPFSRTYICQLESAGVNGDFKREITAELAGAIGSIFRSSQSGEHTDAIL